jgi:hypothetical protein
MRFRRAVVCVLASFALLGVGAASGGELEEMRIDRIDLEAAGPGGGPHLLASIVSPRDRVKSLVVRSVDSVKGYQLGSDAILPYAEQDGFVPVDVRISSIVSPRDLLLLGESGEVRLVRLKLDDDATPVPVGEERLTPAGFMDGSVRLAEMPNPDDPSRPLLGLGTEDGRVGIAVLADDGGTPSVDEFVAFAPGLRAIDDLEVVPRVGHLAFAALSGGDVHLIDPGTADGGLRPELTATVVDPRRLDDDSVPPLVDFNHSGGVNVLDSPEPLPIVTANGTAAVVTYELPGITDGTSNTLVLKELEAVSEPIRQVVAGSLTTLTVDGTGVGYDRLFAPGEGVLRTSWTIAGARAEVAPERLRGAGQGRRLTAWIEVASGKAAEIDPSTVVLEVGGTTLPAVQQPAPALVFHDPDQNPELEVAFLRGRVVAAAAPGGDEVPVTLRWRNLDGSEGSAQTVLRH